MWSHWKLFIMNWKSRKLKKTNTEWTRDGIASNADVLSFLKASSRVPSIRNARPSRKNVCRGGYQQLSTLSYLLSSDNCIFFSLCLFTGYNNRRKCEHYPARETLNNGISLLKSISKEPRPGLFFLRREKPCVVGWFPRRISTQCLYLCKNEMKGSFSLLYEIVGTVRAEATFSRYELACEK